MMLSLIRRYLIAGLLVWVPILVTVFVIQFIVSIMDKSLALLPKAWQPVNLLGFHAPGLGVVLSLLVLFFTGMFVTNFLGRRLVALWDNIIDRIPLVRAVYSAVKQVMNTIFMPGGNAFRKVLLVEYPRRGMWSIAFQTSESGDHFNKQVGEEMVTVFIPTTPNPTSGFLMMVPRSDVKTVDISVDQAIKFVISLGVVQPISFIEEALRSEKEGKHEH